MEKNKNTDMSFLEHLEELRWHLVRSVVALVIFALAAFGFKSIIFDIVLMGPSQSDFPTTKLLCDFGRIIYDFFVSIGKEFGSPDALCLNDKSIEIKNFTMAGQFLAHIKISFIAGIIVTFPYIVFEFWRFIRPALHKNEKKHARGAVFAISLLFMLGVSFGYFIISPLSINFLYNYNLSNSVENLPKLMSYVSIVASISLASGILFELPAIIYFLSRIGLVTPSFLKKYRRHSLVVMLVLSAIITPPDVFSQLLVCLPLIVLYEISIRISKRINKKREATEISS